MFEVIQEQFSDGYVTIPCYSLTSKRHKLYVYAFSSSRDETEHVCNLLNNADTDTDNLRYIIEDLVAQRNLVYQ